MRLLTVGRKEGCTTAAFDRAAMNNHVQVVMWLLNNRDEGGTDKSLQWAISRGHTQVLTQPFSCFSFFFGLHFYAMGLSWYTLH